MGIISVIIGLGVFILKEFIRKLLKYKPFIFLDHLAYRVDEDAIFAIGAQLAYFLILSIFPFIILLLNIISFTPLVRIDVLNEIIQYLPTDVQSIINTFADDIVINSSQGLLSIAALAGVWTASTGVNSAIKAINRAYDYEETRSFIELRFLSILFTIVLILLLIIVFAMLVVGEILGIKIFELLGHKKAFLDMWRNIRFIIPFIFMTITFSLLYKFSPCLKKDCKIRFRDTLPGSIFSSIGWILISSAFSYYVKNFGRYSATYGSIGGVIVLLIWLYMSSIIVVLGGEVNASISYLKAHELNAGEKSFIRRIFKFD